MIVPRSLRLCAAILAALTALLSTAAMAQVQTPGAGGSGSGSRLVFENEQVKLEFKKVQRNKDGSEVRVAMAITNKTDEPVWVILVQPRATIIDENASMLPAQRVTGMESCNLNGQDWNGQIPTCIKTRRDHYTKLEPHVAFPFALQFAAGKDDTKEKLEPGLLEIALRMQLAKAEDGEMGRKASTFDLTIGDIEAR